MISQLHQPAKTSRQPLRQPRTPACRSGLQSTAVSAVQVGSRVAVPAIEPAKACGRRPLRSTNSNDGLQRPSSARESKGRPPNRTMPDQAGQKQRLKVVLPSVPTLM